jgi:HK97 family phage major capsid protein
MGESLMDQIDELLREIKDARQTLERGDTVTKRRIDQLENGLNELFRERRRPGPGAEGIGELGGERKDAIGLCQTRHALQVPKADGLTADYSPTSDEIATALTAKQAFSKLWRHADFGKLDQLEQKALSAFSLGNLGWVLPPETSNRIVSCLTEQTNVGGLVGQVSISSGSLKVPIDNSDAGIDDSAWACDSTCFANNPNSKLGDGLGELEIKAEEIRHVVCATSDLIQDASFPIERWILDKVSRGFRDLISKSIMVGDGVGKPVGLLNPAAGIPVCDTGDGTPPGQFTWQDLVSLAFRIPQQWHPNARFFMNQKTLSLLLTMSDASGRPLLLPTPVIGDGGQRGGSFSVAGWPITIVSQMPDLQPGSAPVMFGDLSAAYLLVSRRAVTMIADPYSAGFCHLWKFSARVGGAVLCPNAARLLRIR